MSIVSDAASVMKERLNESGCDEGTVVLKKCPECQGCPFEEGTCLSASFGAKVSEITTSYPIEASTCVSFMYDKPLKSPEQRTAACAIMNAVSQFMCFIRTGKACSGGKHMKCVQELGKEVSGKSVYINGNIQNIRLFIENVSESPDQCDVMIVGADGIFNKDMLAITEKAIADSKEVIFFGPASAGLAYYTGHKHFCPYAER